LKGGDGSEADIRSAREPAKEGKGKGKEKKGGTEVGNRKNGRVDRRLSRARSEFPVICGQRWRAISTALLLHGRGDYAFYLERSGGETRRERLSSAFGGWDRDLVGVFYERWLDNFAGAGGGRNPEALFQLLIRPKSATFHEASRNFTSEYKNCPGWDFAERGNPIEVSGKQHDRCVISRPQPGQ